jgi:hypothetical protein
MSDQADVQGFPGLTESVTRRLPLQNRSTSWWDAYSASLAASTMSPTAHEVLEVDSHYIVDRAIEADGPAGDARWPVSRVRRGLVMGAVQSGKTASMIGVTALGVDRGVGVVVILAGTRVALWKQTYERLIGQLRLEEEASGRRFALLPQPSLMALDTGSSLGDTYTLNAAKVRRALARRTPILIVAMKNVHHLRALAETLHERLVPAIERESRPVHFLVLDDEADEGSILDARVEQGLDPALDDLKQVPRAIVDLWERRPHHGTTAAADLYVTYLAYTATPQANFLQSDHNPLAPKDFAVSLRTPFDVGDLEPRSTTYTDPSGLSSFYTGGETYYRRLGEVLVCEPPTGSPQDAIGQAMRAFLVGAAIRGWREGDRLTIAEAKNTAFESQLAARTRSPQPTSMLIHPSAAVEDHFAAAAEVWSWAAGCSFDEARAHIEAGDRGLPAENLRQAIEADPEPWALWVDRYLSSSREVARVFGLLEEPEIPTRAGWKLVRALLCDDIIPNTRIAIVNSDPAADDRPRFAPQLGNDGAWRSAPDLSTIFVSGNVMSRGLTLEGLITTLFLRRTDAPYADTQMQMQRWFGYRGPYLELCRVFVPQVQVSLFRAYHETDEALRREVVRAMNENPVTPPSPKVLQGRVFAATGKLTSLASVPLSPGASPFVRLINDGLEPDPNVRLLREVFRATSHEVSVGGTLRGRVLEATWTLIEVAALLDQLRYEAYAPSHEGWEAERWTSIETHVGIDELSADQLSPLYRPPPLHDTVATSPSRVDCPYAMAAYLRLWQACLSRSARGLFATDDPNLPWSMLDLKRKQREQPRFYVGIRFGSGRAVNSGELAQLPFEVRPMRRALADGRLVAGWGSRNPGRGPNPYLGDELFDYHVHGQRPPSAFAGEPLWRPVGAPGLLLFHVIQAEGQIHPTATVGLGIPLGGPDQFAAQSAQ